MYPLKLEPVYIEKVWGGESLEITENGVISNGLYEGTTLYEVINQEPEHYLGKNILFENHFPLMLKIINAKADLSIQIHPADEYDEDGKLYFKGKNEAWYILDAPENAKIILGLKPGVTKDILLELSEKGKIINSLRSISVKKGDVINIPAGMVHAITKGIVLMEIQQNSDITYRLYDYERLWKNEKRKLHIKEALEAINYNLPGNKNPIRGLSIEKEGVLENYYICNNHFTFIKYEFKNKYTENSDADKFFILTMADGFGKIEYEEGITEIFPRESLFIPAAMGKYTLRGKGTVIKTFAGEKEKDFLSPLLSYGYSMEEITENTWVYPV